MSKGDAHAELNFVGNKRSPQRFMKHALFLPQGSMGVLGLSMTQSGSDIGHDSVAIPSVPAAQEWWFPEDVGRKPWRQCEGVGEGVAALGRTSLDEPSWNHSQTWTFQTLAMPAVGSMRITLTTPTVSQPVPFILASYNHELHHEIGGTL
jgi:hypothetical protein